MEANKSRVGQKRPDAKKVLGRWLAGRQRFRQKSRALRSNHLGRNEKRPPSLFLDLELASSDETSSSVKRQTVESAETSASALKWIII